jgi:hypothetical protein
VTRLRQLSKIALNTKAITAIRVLAAVQSILIRDGIAPEAVRFEWRAVRATAGNRTCGRKRAPNHRGTSGACPIFRAALG